MRDESNALAEPADNRPTPMPIWAILGVCTAICACTSHLAFHRGRLPQQEKSVQRLSELLVLDRSVGSTRALEEMLLLSPADVLDRLGMPSESDVRQDGAVEWHYGSDSGGFSVVFVHAQCVCLAQ